MNDISVKIVDFGKEQTGVEIVAPADPVPENEVDPLAIEESKVKGEAEVIETVDSTEVLEVPAKPEIQNTVESCDQNAKDENFSVNQDLESEELKLQTQRIKEDLLKEDTISLASTTEDPTEEPEALQNGADLDTTQTESGLIVDTSEDVECASREAIEDPEITKGPVVPIVSDTPKVPVLEESVVSVTPAVVLPPVAALVVPTVPVVPVVPAVPITPTPFVASTVPITPDIAEGPSVTISSSFPSQTAKVAPIVSVAPTVTLASTPFSVPTISIAPSVSITPVAVSVTPAVSKTLDLPEVASSPITPIVPATPIVPEVPKVKEPSPPKELPVEPVKEEEVKLLERIVEKVVEADVEMIEAPIKVKTEEKLTAKTVQAVNGDVAKEDQATKRRSSQEAETESPLKKLCQEVEKTFPQHDTMINDYIQTATKNNIDEIQRHTEQLLAEIQTLRELAQKKEHEWNNILHLKKVKEEILLRLLRRKQVLSFEKAADVNGSDRTDPFDYLNQAKNLAIDKSDEISGLSLKPPCSTMNTMIQPPVMPVTTHFNPMIGLPPPYDKAAHMQSMPKPVFPQPLLLPGPTMPGFPRDMNGQLPTGFGMPMGRQGPTKDVKSIIADYRQRNPDITPRRGRRMKSILNPNMMNMNNPRAIAPKMMENMNNYNNLNNLNMLFNNLDMNQKAMLERLQQIQAGALPNGVSFKDVLVQFANMQQPPGMPGVPGVPRPPEASPRPEHHAPPRPERRRERHEEPTQTKQAERMASPSPRLPPPPPYPEISLLPVNSGQEPAQSSLLHGILTKATPQSYSPTLAKLLTSPERKQAPNLPAFGQAKNCGEITITPVQPTPPPADAAEKPEEVVQLDDEESPASEGSAAASPADGGRLVIDEAADDAPLCQGCRRRAAQFVCAGCANQWYCSRDCQVAAWDDHSEMCSG